MRIDKLRQAMTENELPAVLITSSPNVFYFSGFTGTNGTLFITMDRKYLLTDFRYIEQAEKEANGFEVIRVDSEPSVEIGKLSEGLQSIGIEENTLSWAEYRRFKEAAGNCRLADASEIFNRLREVKDPAEIEILRKAIRITDEAFAMILDRLKPGVQEEEIALELEFSLRRLGASGRSFDYIVASGGRSALPHGVASSKKIIAGEAVTLDFGAKYQWYCSDMTRTVFIGQPEAKYRELYRIVLEAQEAAIQALKPGMTGKEADAVARDVIGKAGYGDFFGHGLGHSLGLEIHETPRLNTRENKVLEPGMILTVEPGIYLPGWGGVRIEDVILVTNFGAEVLTQASKQFIIID
ncbi:MAG: aminopeptidase P family protein [Peptococcaceae bacterium]|nr:aminopeptidase P family protein [Peptococcaceae bacterium]